MLHVIVGNCDRLWLQKATSSSTVVVATVAGPRPTSSLHSLHHGSLPRPALTSSRSFDHPGHQRRHHAPHYFGPPSSSMHGFVRRNFNPGSRNPGLRGPADPSAYRGSVPNVHGEYATQSPRPTASYHHLEQSQVYTPVAWPGPPVAQGIPMPVHPGQDKFLGPPPQVFALQQSPGQSAPESFTSSPIYAPYSPQVAPPSNYGASQPQYLPAVPPPNQQLFVVANTQLVPGAGVQQTPPSGQFTPSGQPSYQVGFVPAGQMVANQAPAMPQQAVSSASPGCVVASPPQQYVVANQPVVMQPAPVNQPFVAQHFTKTTPPNMMPQHFIMMPTPQYVVPPPAQPGTAPPPVSQVYSVVANPNVPQPNGPPPCLVQPVLAGQRMPVHVAAMPNQFQPVVVPANQLQVMPANQIPPVAVGHLQVVPAGALPIVSTNQPPPSAPTNQIQSVATSQPAPPPQPVYCYMPSMSIGSSAGTVPTNELRPTAVPINSSIQQQQQPAAANIQVQ